MKHLIICLLIVLLIAVPTKALAFEPPEAPESALPYMPDETESFGEGLLFVIREAIRKTQPGFTEAAGVCAVAVGITAAISILSCFSEKQDAIFNLAGTLIVSVLMLQPTKSLIRLSTQTITEISEYSNLLLPVMTGAMAAQGLVTKSAAIYTATAFFNMVLSSVISELLVPLVYIYISLIVCSRAFSGQILANIRKFLKWLMTWGLKTILYVFTGYLGITGIVAGSTDAAMLKATKLTISGMVPVVGGILSDASEAVLVSAGLVRNSVGIYGMLAVIALWIGPFLKIGVQYLCLKITGGVCHAFGSGSIGNVINDFSETMGILLAMTGTMCVIVLISTVCFLKGVG